MMAASGQPLTPEQPIVRPCTHCGPGLNFFTPQLIADRLKEIPLDHSLAAEAGIYQKRMEACAACEALSAQVLCAHCGCFILFRARPAKSYCPHPAGDRWIKSGTGAESTL